MDIIGYVSSWDMGIAPAKIGNMIEHERWVKSWISYGIVGMTLAIYIYLLNILLNCFVGRHRALILTLGFLALLQAAPGSVGRFF